MNILVCISKTQDTTAKISFKNDSKEFNSDGVQFILNPYDEWYALVRAIEIKEQVGGNVVALNVGGSDTEAIIRKALAIGADEAVRINAEPTDSMFTAFQIAEYAKSKGFDLILLGKETIDYNGSELGAMLAEYLDLPYVSYASSLTIDGSKATVQRDIEGGVEISELNVPCVISAAKGLAEQRIPNMKGIMMAKSKPLTVVEPEGFDSKIQTIGFTVPPAKSSIKMVDPNDMDELVRLLSEEAKVL